MLTVQDLSSIFELFGQGIVIGGLLSAIVWAVAYAIKAFISFISTAS